jgi:hypothetical protein
MRNKQIQEIVEHVPNKFDVVTLTPVDRINNPRLLERRRYTDGGSATTLWQLMVTSLDNWSLWVDQHRHVLN